MADYSIEDKEEMIKANVARLNAHKSRLQELIEFIKVSGFQKIGIANCLSMQKYADKLAEILRENGFTVFSVNCKESGLDGCVICEEMKGPCCDPISHAKFLNDQKTEFNINVGLCLGHGLLFQKYSRAPVTTFIVKDFAHEHNVAASLF